MITVQSKNETCSDQIKRVYCGPKQSQIKNKVYKTTGYNTQGSTCTATFHWGWFDSHESRSPWKL